MKAVDTVERVLETNSVAVIYPQTLLALIMILNGETYWYPQIITISRDKCKGFTRIKCERYQSPGSRYKQTLLY